MAGKVWLSIFSSMSLFQFFLRISMRRNPTASGKVWLRISMRRNPTASPVFFKLAILKSWLIEHTQGDLDGLNAHVRLNFDGPQIWDTFVSIPFFGALGASKMKLKVNLFVSPAWQRQVRLRVNGYGPIRKVVGEAELDYDCELHSGAVEVWTRDGFGPAAEFFNFHDSIQTFNEWRRSIWPQANEQVAAIRFGANDIQIEVLGGSQRTRSTLVDERPRNQPQERLWKLSDCDTHDNLKTPRQIIDGLRQRIVDTLKLSHWDDTLAIVDRRELVEQTPPAVYYLSPISRTTKPVTQFLRPDFDVEFKSDGTAIRWSPFTVSIEEPRIELHDSDHIAAAIAAVKPPRDEVSPIHLTWHGDGALPRLIEGKLPISRCVGVTSGQVQDGYVWQYAYTDVALSTTANVPVMVRHAIPQISRPDESRTLPKNVDGPIPIARRVIPDQWQLLLSPQTKEVPTPFAKTVSLTVATDAMRQVDLKIFAGTMRADSPPLLQFTPRLANSSSFPNLVLVDGDDSQHGDPFAPTSLIFASDVLDPVQPIAQLQLEGTAGNPVLFVHSSADSAPSEALKLFWPHAPTALIDPVSAAARNLLQTRDLETLRTIVERDSSHGVSAYGLQKFRLRADNRIRTRAGGAAMAMLDDIAGLKTFRPELHSAMSLLPWVACRDHPGGAALKQLHHRNLALEPGEFAAASQDRSIDGRPMAFANTERDFLEAVRDPFTLGVSDLPTQPAPAAEIVQWLPGASLNASPAARIVPAVMTMNLRDRFPAVALIDGLGGPFQELQVLYRDGSGTPSSEPTDWLTYNLRRTGWDTGTPPKPRIELAPASTIADGRWRRARNASAPLLFDDATITAAYAAALPMTGAEKSANWVCLGDQQGRIAVVDLARPTGRHYLRDETSAASAPIRATVVAAVDSKRWVVAVDGQGAFFVWKSTGPLAGLTAVSGALANAGVTALGAACSVQGLIALFTANPAGGNVLLQIWDPTAPTTGANPVRVTSFPSVTAANISAVSLAPDGPDLLLAVAQTGNAIVLRGVLMSGSWQFTVVNFQSPVAARLIAVHADAAHHALVATVEGDTDCKVWMESSHELECIDSLTAPALATTVAVSPWTSRDWLRPFSDEVRAIVHLATKSTSNSPSLIAGWFVAPHLAASRAPDRQMPGNNGPAGQLLAVVCSTPAIGERLPTVDRPCLLAFGAEGIARLWDIDAEQAYLGLSIHESVYDNAGTLRPSRLAPLAQVDWVNRPGKISAKRSEAASQYASPRSIAEFSFIPVPPDDVLLRSKADPEAVSEIFLMCDQLRLVRQENGTWIPEAFADDLDPGPDRPRLPFPFHRGPAGVFGMFSLIQGESEELNYFPRLAGLPIYPTRLNFLKFEADDPPEFARLDEIEFEAALINPVAIRHSDAHFEIPPPVPAFVHQAVTDNSIIRVLLKRNRSGEMEVASIVAIGGKISWTLVSSDAPVAADEEIDGRLAKVTATVGHEMFVLPRIGGDVRVGRLVFRLAPAECVVEILAGNSSLENVELALVGFGLREKHGGQRVFGFEVPRLHPVTASSGMPPLPLFRSREQIDLADDLRALAIDGLASAPASGSVISADATGNVIWSDLLTAKPWSSHNVGGAVTDLADGLIRSATAIFAFGTRLQAVDVELNKDWIPGAVEDPVNARSDWSAGEPITALAATNDRIFVGNAAGKLLVWDDFGMRKLAVAPFAGPILQVAAAARSSEIIVVTLDSTQSQIGLVDGVTGIVLLQRQTVELFGTVRPLQQVAIRWMANDLLLAVLQEGKARWWKVVRDANGRTMSVAAPLSETPDGHMPTAIAVGAEGAQPALFYVDNLKVRRLFADGSVAEVGDSPDPQASIDFAQDEANQILVAAAPAKPIRIWERPLTGMAWTMRNLDVPAELGEATRGESATGGNAHDHHRRARRATYRSRGADGPHRPGLQRGDGRGDGQSPGPARRRRGRFPRPAPSCDAAAGAACSGVSRKRHGGPRRRPESRP